MELFDIMIYERQKHMQNGEKIRCYNVHDGEGIFTLEMKDETHHFSFGPVDVGRAPDIVLNRIVKTLKENKRQKEIEVTNSEVSIIKGEIIIRMMTRHEL